MLPSSRSALQLFINRLASRSTLTDEEEGAILDLTGREERIVAHIDFVREGENADHSCLIVEGLAARFKQNRKGGRQSTCLYIPGDMADLPSVVSPRSAGGLSALTNTTILRLSNTDLRRIAAQHAGIAEAFWRDCVADGSIFSEWVVNVGRRGAIARIAHLLCEMAIRCERAGQGERLAFRLPITQADFGDATGLTSVHVNRMLRELRERSIATLQTGLVTIHDWDQLVGVGEFDADFLLLDGPAPRIVAMA